MPGHDAKSPQIPRYRCCRSGSAINCSDRAAPHRPSALDDVVAVGDAGEVGDVLVDHQHRLPAALQHRQAVPDFLADQRREAFGGFVEDQQFRIGHQRAADRQHLLLAAGQRHAHVAAALGEPRKQRVDFLDGPGIGIAETVAGGGDEIFVHRQVRKDLAAFRHQADAEFCDLIRRQAAHFLAGEADRACAGRRHAHDGADGRGLAHAVAAHQGDHLARLDLQRQAEQHLAEAVAGLDAVDFEQGFSHFAFQPWLVTACCSPR